VQESAVGTRCLADEVSHLRAALKVFKLLDSPDAGEPDNHYLQLAAV
jgi:hypothetical protein